MNNYIHVTGFTGKKKHLQFYQADHKDWSGKGPNQIIWEWNPTAENNKIRIIHYKPRTKKKEKKYGSENSSIYVFTIDKRPFL